MTLQQLQGKNRKISILRTGLSINGILDILELTESPVRYMGLHQKSKIHYKSAFIKYLKYCVEKGFVHNEKVFGRKNKIKPRESWFVITEKGRAFQEIIA